mgnify:CR=1 FL=1
MTPFPSPEQELEAESHTADNAEETASGPQAFRRYLQQVTGEAPGGLDALQARSARHALRRHRLGLPLAPAQIRLLARALAAQFLRRQENEGRDAHPGGSLPS